MPAYTCTHARTQAHILTQTGAHGPHAHTGTQRHMYTETILYYYILNIFFAVVIRIQIIIYV